MLKLNFASLKKQLLAHYTSSFAVVFKQFRAGAIYFTVGLMIIFMANQYLESSVIQELVTLCGITLGGFGFVWAMMAYIRMVIGRIINFWIKD